MALYQPSNIIPSSFAGGESGVISVADPVVISWQVNGNSTMSAFKIDFYENDAESTFRGTTNVRTDNCPFVGKDAKGNVVLFRWAPFQSSFSWGGINLVDGKSYKMKITQYWGALSNGSYEHSVTQISPTVFITRTKPTLVIDGYTNTEERIGSIKVSFTATYSQAQGDSINWVRWQLIRRGTEEIIEDTGEVNTSILKFDVDGILPDRYYVKCTVETQSGMIVSKNANFRIDYEEEKLYDRITESVQSDSSVLISVDREGFNRPLGGTPSPVEGYGKYTDEHLDLYDGSSITFDLKRFPLNKYSGNTVWIGDVTGVETLSEFVIEDAKITGSEFSPDHQYLFVSYVTNGTYQTFLNLYRLSPSMEFVKRFSANDLGFYSGSSVNGFKIAVSYSAEHIFLMSEGTGEVNICEFDSVTGDLTYVFTLLTEGATDIYFSKTGTGYLTSALFAVAKGLDGVTVYGYQYSSDIVDPFLSFVPKINGDQYFAKKVIFCGNYLIVGLKDCYDAYAISYQIYTEGGNWEIIGNQNEFMQEYDGNATCIDLKTVSDSSLEFYCLYTETEEILAPDLVYDADIAKADDPNEYFKAPATSQNEYLLTTFILDSVFVGDYAYSSYKDTDEYNDVIYEGTCSWNAKGEENEDEYYFRTYEFGIVMGGYVENDVHYLLTKSQDSSPVLRFCKRTEGEKIITLTGNISSVDPSTLEITRYFDRLVVGPSSIYLNGALASFVFGYDGTKLIFYNNLDYYSDDWESTSLTVFPSSIKIDGWQKVYFVGVDNEEDISGDWDTRILGLPNFLYVWKSLEHYLYRKEDGRIQKIYKLGDSFRIKDFGVKSNLRHSYDLVQAYDDIIGDVFVSKESCVRYTSYYLIEAAFASENTYLVKNVWRFGNNINAGSVSNNNSPSFLTNFTPYRLKQPTSMMGKSGTLQALLGNAKDGKYEDTAKQMEELYNLSQTENTLFLKDMKGNIYMVTVSGPITQTINTATAGQEVTVSIPWEEIGDASNVSLIQVDFEENEVSKVSLDADPTTGILSASYPDGYFGTTFKMFNNDLLASTPDILSPPSLVVDGNGDLIKEEES